MEWFLQHKELLTWVGILSLGFALLSPLMMYFLVSRMPADYFMHPHHHSKVNILLHILKNLLGILLVIAGIAMLVLPGQGVITILLGLGLIEFPGKKSLELKIISQPNVLKTVQWARHRAGVSPLQLPD